ncbi:hypothetical protein M426DRAFT_14465 [Hypoxylon sp. CI-4A]|nr:hypothetical protein M426DRAFT_14465 [Hypoxylon sp. CI-4A]
MSTKNISGLSLNLNKVPARPRQPSGISNSTHINAVQHHQTSPPDDHYDHHPRHQKESGKSYGATEKWLKRSGRSSNSKVHEDHKPIDGLLSHNPKNRTKHPKLRGADVYVCRLGNKQRCPGKRSDEEKEVRVGAKQQADPVGDSLLVVPLSPTKGPIASGSLHDELLCKESKPAPDQSLENNSSEACIDRGNILDSRPCYRCVLYMYSAGIRRVIWTNNEGKWESAKVRDLFDQISGTNLCDGHNANKGSLGGVYVTKHEILRLRKQVASY